jgi:hypothetical protein
VVLVGRVIPELVQRDLDLSAALGAPHDRDVERAAQDLGEKGDDVDAHENKKILDGINGIG